MNKLARIFFAALVIASSLAALVPPATARADDSERCSDQRMHGRYLCLGYYTNEGLHPDDFPLRNGIFVNNINDFVSSIRNYLNSSNRQDQVGASMEVNIMLGKDGPEFGGSQDNGIRFARDNFGRWESLVREYDRLGLIDWNYRWSTPDNYINSSYDIRYHDLSFFTLDRETIEVIRFRMPPGVGGEPYTIQRICGNFTGRGELPPPKPTNYEFDANSTVSGQDQNSGGNYVNDKKYIYAMPGTTVRFGHTLTNTGEAPGNTNYTVQQVNPNGSQQPAPPKTTNPARANPGNIRLAPNERQLINENNFTVPANAQPGQVYCQYVSYQPTSTTNSGASNRRDKQACVEVAYNYSLRPSATASETTGSNSTTVSFTYTIDNTGQTTSRSTTTWTVQQLVIQPGTTFNLPGTVTDNASCANFVRAGVTCSQIHSGNPQPFSPGTTTLPNNPATNLSLSNYPAGTKICRILTVAPPTQNNNPSNRWSVPSCVTVGKYPTVHFMSGDISVGGAYPSAAGTCTHRQDSGNVYTVANSTTSGSTVEYAGFIRGSINQNSGSKKGFGTASLTATASQRITAWRLAFANSSNPAGKFGDDPHCMTDYYSRFAPQIGGEASPPSVDLGAINQNRIHYTGDIRIQRSQIPAGKSLIVVVDGKVTIAGDITYPGSYANFDAIPSIAIVARGSIIVEEGVKRLDGSYFTRGTFETCQVTGRLSTGLCNQQLVLNGALYTDKLQLRRTAGENSDPAERFVYGAELLYKNVLEPSGSLKHIDTINQQDLPPRY
ncbi:hypothetical protein JNJ66_06325 [Candidatus Saccharibacteria bacterium]|nr:hypothetical protein [Candidatus Saccharibacteria bacterium]